MRIAIVADIHGNLPALEAVTADLERLAPDQVVVAGDVINRGPQSRECLQAVRAQGWTVVFGNHEEYVLKSASGHAPEEFLTDWWLPMRSVADILDQEELAYLRALPWSHVVAAPGLPPVRIVHGSPRQLNEGLGFWMSETELREAVESAPEPVIVAAHTHRPFDCHLDRWWVLNCGSVGAPFNGDPAAQYLVLDSQNRHWNVDFRAVPYDRAPVYAAWERGGQLERCTVAQIFRYEVETATFHLVPYLDFCEQYGLDRLDQASFARYRAASECSRQPGACLHSRMEPDSRS